MRPRLVRLVHRVLLLLSSPAHPLSLGCRLTATPHCAFISLWSWWLDSASVVFPHYFRGLEDSSVFLSPIKMLYRFMPSSSFLFGANSQLPASLPCQGESCWKVLQTSGGRNSSQSPVPTLLASSSQASSCQSPYEGPLPPLTLVLLCDSFYHAVTQPEGPH